MTYYIYVGLIPLFVIIFVIHAFSFLFLMVLHFSHDTLIFSWDKVHYIRSSTNCIHCLIYFHKLFSSTTKVEVTRSTNDRKKYQKKKWRSVINLVVIIDKQTTRESYIISFKQRMWRLFICVSIQAEGPVGSQKLAEGIKDSK